MARSSVHPPWRSTVLRPALIVVMKRAATASSCSPRSRSLVREPWQGSLLFARLCSSSHCREERRAELQAIVDCRPAVELRAEADALLHEHHGDLGLLIEPVRVAAGPLAGAQLLRRGGVEA